MAIPGVCAKLFLSDLNFCGAKREVLASMLATYLGSLWLKIYVNESNRVGLRKKRTNTVRSMCVYGAYCLLHKFFQFGKVADW